MRFMCCVLLPQAIFIIKATKNNKNDNRNEYSASYLHPQVSHLVSKNKQQRKIIKIEYFCVCIFLSMLFVMLR